MEIKIEKKIAYLQETKDAIKSALIEKGQTVSDTDTFRSYAEKILGIEVGGGATAEDIIPEQELTFVYDESSYAYVLSGHNLFNVTSIALGKKYKVVWGSDEYSCTAVEGIFLGQYPMIGIGNPIAIGGENNNMPFAIGYIPIPDDGDSQYSCIIVSLDGSASKRVRVYQDVGNEKEVRYTSGTFTPTANKTVHTITHGLGVVPDLIVVQIAKTIKETDMPNYYNTIYGGFAFSSAFLEKLPSDMRGVFGAWWTWIGGDFGFVNAGTGGLDEPESSLKKIYGLIRGANASTFMVGGTSNQMPKDVPYHWYALTGLL